MQARELLEKGELVAALAALTDDVKKSPTDPTLRTFLFELLCYAGDLVRAQRQLDAIGQLARDPDGVVAVQVYRDLVAAEAARALLFNDGKPPRFLLDPPAATTLHLEALAALRNGRADEARALVDRAEAATGPLQLEAGGLSVDAFRDGDDILAPVLEVFSGASYFWMPWEHVQYLEVTPPKTLRDLLWIPARLGTFDGQVGEVFLPNLYPGSSKTSDDLVRLGRKTDWVDSGAGIIRGLGQKMFLIGDDARTLLELGELRFAFSGDDARLPDAPSTAEDEA